MGSNGRFPVRAPARLNLLQHVRQVEVRASVSPFETLERRQHLVTTGHEPTPEASAAALIATAQSIRSGQASSKSSDDTATPFAPSR